MVSYITFSLHESEIFINIYIKMRLIIVKVFSMSHNLMIN